MTSAAAKKAWETRRHHGSSAKRTSAKARKAMRVLRSAVENRGSTAACAVSTMRKGKRIKIHSTSVNVGSSQKGTYAPPKKWWGHMTKDPHGSAGKPLSAAAAGHLWFKSYDNRKRLQILKEYG